MALFVEDGDLARTAPDIIVTLIYFKCFCPCNSSDSMNCYTGVSHLTAFSNNPFSSSTVNA